ncbi:MAG: DUF2950 domain-containing protein [Xanthomonadales bacterium]|nr:DUF2950 domain-containing protein [Xanthomonadales bacterium]
MNLLIKRSTIILTVGLILILVSACKQQSQLVFDTPEAAIQALSELIGQNDDQLAEQVFGPGSLDLFRSGDADADREDSQRVKDMIDEWVGFEDHDENTKIALLGDEAWPLSIPLVKEGKGWRFGTAEGREELLNRRIGRNELWTLTSLHETVDAQREYHSESRDGNPRAFAQKFRSTQGKHDGLYWPTDDDSELSPLGELLAGSESWEDEPHPFHGYLYRILTRRGDNAPGGEMNYLDENGFMTGGFGLIAWPAKYGNSGVMTFMVNHRGLVFENDLGPETGQLASAIDSYDPDQGWTPTDDSMAGAVESGD